MADSVSSAVPRTVLVLGGYRHTLVVVRSLGRAGCEVILGKESGGAASNSSGIERSRYVNRLWVHPPLADSSAFCRSLSESFPNRTPNDFAIFPVGESELIAINSQRESLSPSATIVAVLPETAAICLDKPSTQDLAASQGLLVPRSVLLREGRWREDASAVSFFPIVLKRSRSDRLLLGEKAIFCHTADELEDVLNRLIVSNQGQGQLLAQEKIDGVRHNCRFLAVGGRIHGYSEQIVLWTDRIDGTGCGVAGFLIEPSPLRSEVEKLVTALRYTGVGLAQFIVPQRGSGVFLELNPRLDGSCAIACAAGFDLPLCGLQAHSGIGTTAIPKSFPAGFRYHWLGGDLAGLVHEIRRSPHRRLAVASSWTIGMIHRFFRADLHLTFDLADPIPAVIMHLQIWKNLIRQVPSVFHWLPAQKAKPQLPEGPSQIRHQTMTSAVGAYSNSSKKSHD